MVASDNRYLRIVQHNKNKWYITNPDGMILQDDINLGSEYEAEMFIKAYVSSYLNYRYLIVPKRGVRK